MDAANGANVASVLPRLQMCPSERVEELLPAASDY